MQLSTLIEAVGPRVVHGRAEVDITAVTYRAEAVRPGALHVCVPGFTADGHDFAGRAVANGAAALVVERRLDVDVPQLEVDSARRAMAAAADAFFGHPSGELTVVGITGTNGKTTTVFLMHAVLQAALGSAGMLGTVESRVGGVVEPVARTTPESVDLQAILRRMVDAGDRACAMEVSSHALELDRVDGVRFAAAGFTNLTQDHLDFHPDMEHYFAAKARLFPRPPRARSTSAIPYGRRLAANGRGAGAHLRARARRRRRRAPARGRDRRGRGDRADRLRRRAARCRWTCACGAASTSRTCSARWRSRSFWSCRTRPSGPGSRRCRASPGGSRRSRRASPSRCSSTTRTRRTGSRTCCTRRVRSPRGG